MRFHGRSWEEIGVGKEKLPDEEIDVVTQDVDIDWNFQR